MPRQLKKTKPLIQVFCEGESEQAYTDFLKKQFEDVAVIKRSKSIGLFDEADNLYKKNVKYKNSAQNYPIAVINAEKTVKNLLSDGLPGMEDSDLRNQWLCTNCKTFSNVYEAISYLEKLKIE